MGKVGLAVEDGGGHVGWQRRREGMSCCLPLAVRPLPLPRADAAGRSSSGLSIQSPLALAAFPSPPPDSVWQPQPRSSLGISRGPLPFRRQTWQCHTPARPPSSPSQSLSPSFLLGAWGHWTTTSSPFGPSLFSLLPLPHCRSVTKRRRRRRRKRRPMRARGIVASPECHCPLLHSAAAVAAVVAARARAAACDSRRQSRQRGGRGGRARRRRRREEERERK